MVHEYCRSSAGKRIIYGKSITFAFDVGCFGKIEILRSPHEIRERKLTWKRVALIRDQRFTKKCWEQLKLWDKNTPDNKRNRVTQIRKKVPTIYKNQRTTAYNRSYQKEQPINYGKKIRIDQLIPHTAKYTKGHGLSRSNELPDFEHTTTNKRIIAQVRLAGKLAWTTAIGHGLKYKVEENLTCQICNTGETENRKHILSDCPIYAEIRPSSLKNRQWTEIIKVKTEKQIWEVVNFIKGSMQLRAFCPGDQEQGELNQKEQPDLVCDTQG